MPAIFPKITTKRFLLEEGISRDCRRFRTRLDRVMILYNQNGAPLRRLLIVLPVLMLCIGATSTIPRKEVPHNTTVLTRPLCSTALTAEVLNGAAVHRDTSLVARSTNCASQRTSQAQWGTQMALQLLPSGW